MLTHEIDLGIVLRSILENPGEIPDYYRVFHRYSFLNQMLARYQMKKRGMKVSPIASFGKWNELGRTVKKGEKALVLCRPLTSGPVDQKWNGDPIPGMQFTFEARWFSLDQTEGRPFEQQSVPLPQWDKNLTLPSLAITEEPFSSTDGNCQGYAFERTVAVNPIARFPQKTLVHEVAHVILGHTQKPLWDGEVLPKETRELEAEGTAYVFGHLVGLPGLDASRAYVNSWGAKEITADVGTHVLTAVDRILRAGSKTGAKQWGKPQSPPRGV